MGGGVATADHKFFCVLNVGAAVCLRHTVGVRHADSIAYFGEGRLRDGWGDGGGVTAAHILAEIGGAELCHTLIKVIRAVTIGGSL